MSAQAVFGWWRKTVETERDRPRLIGCREGIFRVKTTHQEGERNCLRWRTPKQVRHRPENRWVSDANQKPPRQRVLTQHREASAGEGNRDRDHPSEGRHPGCRKGSLFGITHDFISACPQCGGPERATARQKLRRCVTTAGKGPLQIVIRNGSRRNCVATRTSARRWP